MKKIIITLCLALVLVISLVSCGRNNNDNNSNGGTDTQNDGMITETGTDTNIIDEVESGMKGIRDNVMGAN